DVAGPNDLAGAIHGRLRADVESARISRHQCCLAEGGIAMHARGVEESHRRYGVLDHAPMLELTGAEVKVQVSRNHQAPGRSPRAPVAAGGLDQARREG